MARRHHTRTIEGYDIEPDSRVTIHGRNKGEVALWRAVIKQAIDDARGFRLGASVGRERAQADVMQWLNSQDFIRVCEMAGLNPDKIRSRFPDVQAQSAVDNLYEGLSGDVIDALECTQLDKPRYIRMLRSLAEPLSRVEADLDRGVRVTEALQDA